jgi:hypothetical protein
MPFSSHQNKKKLRETLRANQVRSDAREVLTVLFSSAVRLGLQHSASTSSMLKVSSKAFKEDHRPSTHFNQAKLNLFHSTIDKRTMAQYE